MRVLAGSHGRSAEQTERGRQCQQRIIFVFQIQDPVEYKYCNGNAVVNNSVATYPSTGHFECS